KPFTATATVASSASCVANSAVSITANPNTPPRALLDSSSGTANPEEVIQPRYMTRSVVQNAVRRKHEQLIIEQASQQQQHSSQLSSIAQPGMTAPNQNAFTFTQNASRSHADANANAAAGQVDPYSLLAYAYSQQHNPTWTSAALYQAARAVAAAADPVPPAQQQAPNEAAPAQPRKKQKTQQQPQPSQQQTTVKRRKNAAATKPAAASQRGGRARATQRSKQQVMSVLSFVVSLFRSRNNNRADDRSPDVRSRKYDATECGTTTTTRHAALHRTLSKHTIKSGAAAQLTHGKNHNHTANDGPNDFRQIFPASKTNPRPLMPKSNGNTLGRRAQQKADASCDDRDGHYVVVPGREFTGRFKIRRLLGQGTFGKVMECEDNASGRVVAIKVIRAVPKYRDAAKIEIRVLQTLQRNDPTNAYQCMHVNETFDYRNHVCMVFDLLGPSVFDFLKENEFRPFSLHHVQLFAEQLLRSVAFLHSLNLVHTDLKPENILLESGAYDVVPFGSSTSVKTRMLRSTRIRLIDFGSATFDNEYHSQVVSTRHYRAPEIILNLGWSFPCDMWSVGCIILELLTGEALFQTHDNNEHLAMMEAVVGRAPAHMVRAVAPDLRARFFRSDGSARPSAEPARHSRGLRAMRPLAQLVNPATNPIYANLHDLLFRLLQYDPRARITAKEACEHPFFRYRVGPDGRLVNRSSQQQQQQQKPQVQPQQQPPQPQEPPLAGTVDLVPSPSSSSLRSLRPSYPSSVLAPQPPAPVVPPTYAYGSTASTGRAPLRVGDYALAAQQQHQQAQVLPPMNPATSASHFYREPPPQLQTHSQLQQHQVQPQHQQHQAQPPMHQQHNIVELHSPHQQEYPGAYTHPYARPGAEWQYAGAAAPRAAAAAPAGFEVQTQHGATRRKGAHIDSGYFPELPSDGGGYPGASGQQSPVAGAVPSSSAQGRGYFAPPAGYGGAKACNLPPINSHPMSYPFPSGPPVSAGIPAQHGGHHQQRHHMLNLTSNGVPMRFLPLDANTTPTLTSATTETATPTPGSSARLGGSHSIECHVPPPSVSGMASGFGAQKQSAVRSLPSLALGSTPTGVSAISNGFARASLADASHTHAAYHHTRPAQVPPSASPMLQQPPARAAFYHLPPAQTLLHPQTHSASLDYGRSQLAPSSADASGF
ncbi:serine threonine protein kinase CMGC group, partial [Coemansia guatemalensis]